MQIQVREAKSGDAAAIARLCGELGYSTSEPGIAERIRRISELKSDFMAVAEGDDGLTGWIQGHVSYTLESGFRAEIVGLIVSKTNRRDGIGRRLVDAVETWARRRDAPVIVVRSNIVRAESHSFYPALGYVEAKTQRVYRKRLSDPA